MPPQPHLRSTCDQVSQPRHTDHCRLQTGGMAPHSLQHCRPADLDWYFIRAQPDIILWVDGDKFFLVGWLRNATNSRQIEMYQTAIFELLIIYTIFDYY